MVPLRAPIPELCIPPKSEKAITPSAGLALEVVVCNQTDIKIDVEELVRLVEVCCSELNPPGIKLVDIALVSKEVMANLHLRYMGLPGPTDVLSFPASDVIDDPFDVVSPQGQPMLGDIVICPAYIERTGGDESRDSKVETCAVHGLLHLLGYDHQTAADAKVMFDKQENLMLSWQRSKQCRS